MNGQRVVAITGPTASGKTAVGAMVAKRIGGEVVSADSMQVYKLMDIGTAKPKSGETLGVPHHMIGVIPLGSPIPQRVMRERPGCACWTSSGGVTCRCWSAARASTSTLFFPEEASLPGAQMP